MYKIIALIEEWRIYLRCILRGKCHPEMCAWLAYRHLTCLEIESDFAFFCPSIALVLIFNIVFTRIKNIEKLNTGRVPAQVVWVDSTGWKNVLSGHPVREPQVNLRVYVFLRVGRNLPNCLRCASEKSSAVLTCTVAMPLMYSVSFQALSSWENTLKFHCPLEEDFCLIFFGTLRPIWLTFPVTLSL